MGRGTYAGKLFVAEQGIEENVELGTMLGRETAVCHRRSKETCKVRAREIERNIAVGYRRQEVCTRLDEFDKTSEIGYVHPCCWWARCPCGWGKRIEE
jgi:cystathionine beta-lyase/cystathionine gamma-synthase